MFESLCIKWPNIMGTTPFIVVNVTYAIYGGPKLDI